MSERKINSFHSWITFKPGTWMAGIEIEPSEVASLRHVQSLLWRHLLVISFSEGVCTKQVKSWPPLLILAFEPCSGIPISVLAQESSLLSHSYENTHAHLTLPHQWGPHFPSPILRASWLTIRSYAVSFRPLRGQLKAFKWIFIAFYSRYVQCLSWRGLTIQKKKMAARCSLLYSPYSPCPWVHLGSRIHALRM